MKKSVKTPIIILLIASLLITSCEMMPTKKEAKKEPTGLTGNQGIEINFIPNMPPARVYPGKITILLRAENKGTSKLEQEKGTLYLSGFDPKIINIDKQNNEVKKEIPELEGRGPYRTQGDIDQIEFTGNINKLSVEKYNTIILATACYKYKTKASTEVCIDPNPFTPTQQPKICTPTDIDLKSGQGAPIAVTKIEVDAAKEKTRFRIHIKNTGKGTAFDESKISKCSPYSEGLSFTDINLIKVEKVTVAGTELENCKPLTNNNLRLTEGEGTLYCEFETQGTGAYITPISITLSYGYRDTTTKQIEVRKT